MWQRFTERARRVVFFSQEEAARLGENYVGTEHILLGLVRESDSVAGRILEQLGVALGRIRADIGRQLTRGHPDLGQDMQLSPASKRVIDLAYEEARLLNNNYIGTEHLLLGLIREGDGLAARVLVKFGADLERTRRVVYQMQELGAAKGAVDTEATEGQAPTAEETRRQAETCLRDLVDTLPAEGILYLEANRAVREGVTSARTICDGLEDFISIADLDCQQAEALLALARLLKRTADAAWNGHDALLAGNSVALIFEKPSLRTRVSFEVGLFHLGAQPIHLSPADIRMGEREPVGDVARNLERWVDGIVARVYHHQTLLDLAANASIPVINGLSDHEHPCQALADFLTLWERRRELPGQKIAYVGDGNNVAHSLILLAAKLGVHLTLACPKGYDPAPEVLAVARPDAERTGAALLVVRDPREAVAEADAVYTDVWTSMGQEAEADDRRRVFEGYQVNAALLAAANSDAIVLHCLPAHRGEEITAEVLDGPQSAVFDQAENRLHVQKAVLAALL
jgi:ornithine carbamoyltransferase